MTTRYGHVLLAVAAALILIGGRVLGEAAMAGNPVGLSNSSSDGLGTKVTAVIEGEELVLECREAHGEREEGALTCRTASGAKATASLGVVRGFGDIFALGGRVVALPYLVGAGSGVAQYDWCAAGVRDGTPYIQRLGRWRYFSAGREHHEFRLLPVLAEPPTTSLARFDFIVWDGSFSDGICIRGRLSLCMGDPGAPEAVTLIPLSLSDAVACLRLLERTDGIADCGASLLTSVCPAEANRYLAARRAGDKSGAIAAMRDVRAAVIRHYAKLDDSE